MMRRILHLLFMGPTPYRRLRMLDGKLQRKVARGRYEPIEPESITPVREYECTRQEGEGK